MELIGFVRRTPGAVLLAGGARGLVMLEQVGGIFYIAMVVTCLIGLQSLRQRA